MKKTYTLTDKQVSYLCFLVRSASIAYENGDEANFFKAMDIAYDIASRVESNFVKSDMMQDWNSDLVKELKEKDYFKNPKF